MKRSNFITTLSFTGLLFFSSIAFSQSSNSNNSDLPSNTNAFGKGTNVLSLGFGVGGDYTYIGDGYTSTPNFVITYDNGTFDHVGPGIISLGGLFSYKGASYDYTDPFSGYYYNQNWNYYILGFRAAYHWNFTRSDRFDPYIGLMLGYYDISYNISSSDPYYKHPGDPYYYYNTESYNSYLSLSLYLGARYYLSNRVGIWLEFGYGYSNAALGLSFKF